MLVDLLTLLFQKGLIQGVGLDAFADALPSSDGMKVALFEYNGTGPIDDLCSARSVQVCVASTDILEAKTKSWELYKFFNENNNIRIASTGRYLLIDLKQTPFKLQVDDLGRSRYVFNMGVVTLFD